MKYPISVIGNCVQDIFILSESKIIPGFSKGKRVKFLSYVYGDKLSVDEISFDLGGEACNVAVAMKKLGIKPAIVSMLGDDIYSWGLVEQLRKKKIGMNFLYHERGKDLGISFILLGPDRDRTILAYRASNDFSKVKIRKLLRSSRSFFIAGINKHSRILLPAILENAILNNKKIYINPSAYQIEYDLSMLKKTIRHSEVAIMNVEEAMWILRLKKNKNIKDLLKKIWALGTKVALITDGKKGSYAYDGNDFYKAGIYSVNTVDTTGAGDSFGATFIAAYTKGYSLDQCLQFAAINSASVVSQFGAQRNLITWKEMKKILKAKNIKVRKI